MALRDDRLMTPAEVAAAFGVDPKTVTRWANAGNLTAVRTLGGHRRYLRQEIMAMVGYNDGDDMVEELEATPRGVV